MTLAGTEARKAHLERQRKRTYFLNRIEQNFRETKSPRTKTESMLQIKDETAGGRFSAENPLCKDPVYDKLINLAKRYESSVRAVDARTKYPESLPDEEAKEYMHNYHMLNAFMNQLFKIEKRTMKVHEYAFFESTSIDEIITTASKSKSAWNIIPDPSRN
ncbi:hypothetical protein KY338_05280 [Candidatus Woesearchaeota archaeon]|nr:hypothetical protein [Candidatus Woesearchaeota archaeon]MBW3006315.1 hypothetical protein [Candidatus Woesearchaeota archaeon]